MESFVTIIHGDLTTSTATWIAHQVSTVGGNAATTKGITKKIFNSFPEVEFDRTLSLGTATCTDWDCTRAVVHLCTEPHEPLELTTHDTHGYLDPFVQNLQQKLRWFQKALGDLAHSIPEGHTVDFSLETEYGCGTVHGQEGDLRVYIR